MILMNQLIGGNVGGVQTEQSRGKTIDQCLNLCLLYIKSLSWTNPWAAMANAAGRAAGNAAANGGSMGK